MIATGRSDYPNQINNVLAFPGVFRGALDAGARAITHDMQIAAAHALANVIAEHVARRRLRRTERLRPSVAPAVARAVAEAAVAEGVARTHMEVKP